MEEKRIEAALGEFLKESYAYATQFKPEMSFLEFEGFIHHLLYEALKNEQLPEISQGAGSPGTPVKPEQIPGTGGTGWSGSSTKRNSSSKPGEKTRNNRKKRRG